MKNNYKILSGVILIGIVIISVSITVILRNKEYSDYIPNGCNQYTTSYRIQSGDTLDTILQDIRENYPETKEIPLSLHREEVLKINNLSNPDRITEGSSIIIPYLLAE